MRKTDTLIDSALSRRGKPLFDTWLGFEPSNLACAMRDVPFAAMLARMRSQFFTPRALAQRCLDALHASGALPRDAHFIEPAAGDGAFVSLLPRERTLAFEMDEALCRAHGHAHAPAPAGYLGVEAAHLPPAFAQRARNVVLGNPPCLLYTSPSPRDS